MRDPITVAKVGHHVLDMTATGLTPVEISTALQSDFRVVASPEHVAAYLKRALADDVTSRAVAIARSRQGAQPLSISEAERKLEDAAFVFEQFLSEVVREYNASPERSAVDLRAFLAKHGCRLNESEWSAFLRIVKHHSLSAALKNATLAASAMREMLELHLKSRGRISDAPQVNVLSISASVDAIVQVLCPDCSARIAGVSIQ